MTDPAIRVEGLTKRFDTVTALDGIDLEIPARTVFGLLGPNGAGKTTTIRVLSTILKPDAGRAEVLGRDVVRQAKEVRTQIGLAGQSATVDPNLTGRENLRLIGRLVHLPRREAARRIDALLDRFQLVAAADRPVRTYSGGMRRRIDLAAALVNRPPVLFLDEPTTGLDPYSRNEVWAMIGELVDDGTTVVLTTQYLEEADRLASRVAVIDEGRVIANDPPAQLKARLGSTVIEIGLADEPTLGSVIVHHARRIAVNAHLLLERAALELVALADAAVVVHQELGYDEQRDALDVVGRARALGEHEVDDVLGKVMLARRDEDLGPGDRITAVRIFLGLRLQKPEVGAAMRLGQVHRAGPAAGNHRRHIFLLELVAALDQQRCNRARSQALVHLEAVVGRKDIFGDRGANDLRQPLPAIFLGPGERRPTRFDELLIGFLEARRGNDRAVVVALATNLVANAVQHATRGSTVVLATGALLPWEIFETIRHPGWGRALLLAVNLAVVMYLLLTVLREHRAIDRQTLRS